MAKSLYGRAFNEYRLARVRKSVDNPATAELVKRHFGFSIDVEKMLGFITDSERQSMEDRDIGAKAYSYFLKQVAINHHRFSSSHSRSAFQRDSGVRDSAR